MGKSARQIEVAGRSIRLSSPDKVMFPGLGITKSEMADYFLAVAEGAVRGVRGRPMILKRFPKGTGQPPFFQKRVPKGCPDWIRTAVLKYPNGRSAEEVVVDDAASLIWTVQQGCVDLNPHAIRVEDLDHPDELRIDLDPLPGVPWSQTLEVALLARDVLLEHGLTSYPKTSGSKGFHILVAIEPRWTFTEVRLAAQAIARELEARAPGRATARWWKEEREGVFVDYNRNAKDSTVASAYSVRPVADARVSAPLFWDEVADCDAAAFTLRTMPARFAELGDPHAPMDTEPRHDLSSLLVRATELEAAEPLKKRRGDGSGRRLPSKPLRTIANSPDQGPALEGLERWKARHPEVVEYLEPHDILVDAMRGRYRTWTRIRVNLQHVPEALHPPQEPPDPDYDPRVEWMGT